MPQEIFRPSDQNPFDAAMPGQSLTNTPRNATWEHPPQFTDVDEAMNFIMKKLTNVQMAEQVILMLKNKIPVEAITRLIIFGGFTEGKWSVDMAVLLTPLVMQLIAAVGMKAKVGKMRITMGDTTGGQFMKDMANFEALSEKAAEDIQEDIQEAPSRERGLMAPPQPEGVV